MKPSAIVTAVALALAFTASLISCAKKPIGPSLDRAAREAIINSACKAVQSAVKGDTKTGNEIPRESWGETISKLHPLRVRNDRIHIFIVLKEDATTEEGLYVSNPISSYAPGVDDRFVRFEKLTQSGDADWGELYECKLKKARTEGAMNVTPKGQ
jgi:hypothetical protein